MTEMEHFDLAANDEPQVVLLTLKSLASVPPKEIPMLLRVTVRLLVKVNFTGLLVVPSLQSRSYGSMGSGSLPGDR